MEPLISVDQLDPGKVSLLDVRYRLGGPPGPEAFAAGHIPGAIYVDLDSALADAPGVRGRHPLPEQGVFQEAMRAAGVGSGPVVVYDDWEGRAAARCWWLLKYYGHPDVRVLDGGWTAWVESGREVSTETTPVAPGDFVARPGGMPVIEVGEVLDFARDHCLIDARQPERYAGEVEPVDPVAGHIPGAINVPTTDNLDSGRFRGPDEIRSTYPEAERIAVYCGSGVTATHDILALATIGVQAALYPGSWSEWVADPSRPVIA